MAATNGSGTAAKWVAAMVAVAALLLTATGLHYGATERIAAVEMNVARHERQLDELAKIKDQIHRIDLILVRIATKEGVTIPQKGE